MAPGRDRDITASHLKRAYSDSLGLRFLREQATVGQFIFTTREARPVAARLGISESYLRKLLHQLAAGGWLMRLRDGLYAGTGSLSGAAEIHPFAIANRLVTPSAVGHWSAMSHHGLAEQIPRVVTSFTPMRFMTPSMRTKTKQTDGSKQAWQVEAVRYEYVIVKPEFFFGIEEVWVDQRFRISITDKERTMLEGFASPRVFGGMGEVLGILGEHLNEFDMKKLVAYALRYGKGSVIKRLGWAMERAGAPA
ncbi:MAG TPA: type IV toxin-antitoxin system AbiEi family antitoxin domain-containing protein, partial [Blastocatellia bacterium]|nr:type IV toxin-antitoxin system AbiEi family antitoxin domain-containing protein [Blastocatellia bacterium]